MTNVLKKAVNIFEEVEKLNFPINEYIIVGSGIMAVKEIRDAYDLDIVVSQKLFEKCKNSGWELKPWTRSGRPGQAWLKQGDVDIMTEIQLGDEDFNLEKLQKEGQLIKGIWFLSLNQLIKFKRQYGRDRDFDDISLIEKYLQKYPD